MSMNTPPSGPEANPNRPAVPTGPPMTGRPSVSFQRRNQLSLITIGVTVVYLVIAFTSTVFLFGIFPAITCFRAFQRKEQLAPLALVAAAAAILVAILAANGKIGPAAIPSP